MSLISIRLQLARIFLSCNKRGIKTAYCILFTIYNDKIRERQIKIMLSIVLGWVLESPSWPPSLGSRIACPPPPSFSFWCWCGGCTYVPRDTKYGHGRPSQGRDNNPQVSQEQEEGQVLGINLGPVNTCVDHLLYLIGVRTFGESSKMTNAWQL